MSICDVCEKVEIVKCDYCKKSELRARECANKDIVFGLTGQKLTADQELSILRIKAIARELYEYVDSLNDNFSAAEFSLAKHKLEECVMWASRGITKYDRTKL
jgi:hypothetical protein